MIITRTPFRISFFGGGTDYPIWYNKNGGAVLSTSINKYCYITCRYLPPFFKYKYKISYSIIEKADHYKEIAHPSVRESIEFIKLPRGVFVSYDADLPAKSGLGSSSSFTVGLLNALYGLKGEIKTEKQLALDSIYIEQEKIKENVGSQDQTAAAFGGFNKIEFGGKQKIKVSPITISQKRLNLLQGHLMIFFTGFSRIASRIAAEQIKQTPKKEKELKTMQPMVDEAINILGANKNIEDFGKLLHENWKIKRSLTSKISTPLIDEIYETGLSAGALGGKILGAGGGGFILFFVKPEMQNMVKKKLNRLIHVPFEFENSGSQIIHYSPTGSDLI